MTSPPDYISYLFTQPNGTLIGIATVFFLSIFRIAPVVVLAPFLGSKLPGGVKMGLVISLSLIYMPYLIQESHTTFSFDIPFIGYSLKELLMGFIIGFLSTIPFYIAQGSGSLVDYMRGSSSLQVQDPMMQAQTSSIGVMFNYTLIVVFFEIGGLFFFLQALTESYRILPIDQFIPMSFFNLQLPFWQTILGLLTQFTAISIQLSAPSIVSILMAEMFLGIANRLAPQVQIVFLGMSFKSLLGLAMLWAAWFFILQQMAKHSIKWIQNIDNILRSM